MGITFEMDWNGSEHKAKVKAIAGKNVSATAKRVVVNAKQLVSVDLGTVKESIEEVIWTNKGVEGAYIQAGEKGEEQIPFFIELGTPGEVYTSGAYKGQNRTPIIASPFLRPALNKEKLRFLNSFKGAL